MTEPAAFLDLVAERLRAAASHAGVTCDDVFTSWAEIDRWSWGVATRLRAERIGRGDVVPVIASRDSGLVAGWLGVLRAGAAYLPVDIDLPKGRVAFLCRDSRARVVLTNTGGSGTAKGAGPTVSVIDIDGIRGAEARPHQVTLTERDIACVLYTSGSTGQPKGVLIDHGTLLHAALRWSWTMQITPEDRMLTAVSVAFDLATQEIGTALVTAGHLVLASDTQRRDPALLGRELSRADFGGMTPSATLAATAGLAVGAGRMRTMLVGGEVLTRSQASEFTERLGGRLINVWGVTECPAFTTTAEVDLERPGPPGIGRPAPGARVYLLGPYLEEIPDGAPGELFIAGAGIGSGYTHRPGLTATRFLPDPFSPIPGARMYRTGDRAVRRPDGTLEYLGRDDHQVKIRGNRVELGEIQAALERCPGVRRAAVTLDGPNRLAGYLQAAGAEPPGRAAVLAVLRQWLPVAVTPTELWLVDSVPLTINGKVDLAALRASPRRALPDDTAAAGGAPDEVSLTRATGLFLAGLPEPPDDDVLPRHADFFVLGGASMAAARLINTAAREFGITLHLRDFLADPTVLGLARLLAGAAGEEPTGDRPATLADAVLGRTAGSAQRRLWFLDHVPQLRTAYLVPSVLAVRGERSSPATLANALQQVLDRHPMLRARFVAGPGGDEVTFHTDRPGPVVALTDARGWDQRAVRTRVSELCRTPFDLAAGPPARAEVIITSSDTLVVVCAHHIAVDGQAVGVLNAEFGEVYRALAEGRPPRLAPAVLPPEADPGSETRALSEVLARLRGAPTEVLLPHDRPRPRVQDTAGGVCPVPLDGVSPSSSLTLAAAEGVTAFMTAAAVLAVALGRRSGQRDFLFAAPWGGRDGALVDAVGMLVNTVVVRVNTTSASTWRELLRLVRADCLEAFRTARAPFDDLVAELHVERDLSRPPITPVQISAGTEEPAPPDLGAGVRCRWLPAEHDRTKYELTLDLAERPEGPTLNLVFARALFDEATVRGLAADLRACWLELDKDLDGPLGLLAKRSTGPALALATGALPGPPQDTAVVHDGVTVPRGTLDAWAWSLADRLGQAGIGPGDIVPVVVSRGPLMLAAWLGVLRAGAAYTPVGVDTPAARIGFVLHDTGAGVVVVDGAGAVAVGGCGTTVTLLAAESPGRGPLRGAETGAARPPDAVRGDDLACVMYTSGTTGQPKGVPVTHANLAAYLRGLHQTHPELAGRRHLLASSADTDFAVTMLYGALASGGSVVIATDGQCLDGAALARLVQEHGVEVVKFTPSHLGALVRTAFRDTLRHLPVVVLGGEAAPPALIHELAALRPSGSVTLNHYGPTETTVGVLTHRLDLQVAGAPPIGVPLPEVRAVVLDASLRPAGTGEVGLLWIAGPQVSGGYLGRPEDTERAFRTDPGLGRIYCTGDLAFVDEAGLVHLRGRADDQLKIRGFRVEPGEVRHAVLGLPGVRQADVFGLRGVLVAATVLDREITSPETVLSALRERLPAPLVPERFIAVEQLPLGATGKVDRAALRAMIEGDRSGLPAADVSPGAAYPAPTGPAAPEAADAITERVRDAWREVLGVSDVGVDQAFFEAGGNSLLMIALLDRLRTMTERHLEVGDLFRCATLRTQAALIGGEHPPPATADGATPAAPIRDDGAAGSTARGGRRLLAARRQRTAQRDTERRAGG